MFEDNMPTFVLVKDGLFAVLYFTIFVKYNKFNLRIEKIILFYILFVFIFGLINRYSYITLLVGYRNYIFYAPLFFIGYDVIEDEDFDRIMKFIIILSIILGLFSIIQYILVEIMSFDHPFLLPFSTYESERVFEEGRFFYTTSIFGTDVSAGLFFLFFYIFNIVYYYKNPGVKSVLLLLINVVAIVLIGKRSPLLIMLILITFSFMYLKIYKKFVNLVFILLFSPLIYFLYSIFSKTDKYFFYKTIEEESKDRTSDILSWIVDTQWSDLFFGRAFGIKSQGIQWLGKDIYTFSSPHESLWLKIIEEGGLVLLLIFVFVISNVLITLYRVSENSKYRKITILFIVYCTLIFIWSSWHFGVAAGDKFLILFWFFSGVFLKLNLSSNKYKLNLQN
jgi:hypothetical protein